MLGPVSSHAAAETRQVVASLKSQPTVAGHSGDHPPDLETLRATPARPHQILIQGNLCAAVGVARNTGRSSRLLGAAVLVGHVQSIRRYPVKSMLGEELDRTYVGPKGVVGDRALRLD